MKKYTDKDVMEFLKESNAIEGVYGGAALNDAKKAWDDLQTHSSLVFSHILECHRLLMENINPRIAGKVRDCNVYIGGRMGADPGTITALLNQWIYKFGSPDHLHEEAGDKGLEEVVRDAHIKFEEIHPFEDGNGRVGRILSNWHRLQLGLPIHIIHEGPEQMEYYKWFKK